MKLKHTGLSALIVIATLFSLVSCEKEKEPAKQILLKGDNQGTHTLIVFTRLNGVNHAARVFCKYAADKAPADTLSYDEAQNTTTHIGYGPHVHFYNLSEGTYFIRAVTEFSGKTAMADTVVNIDALSANEADLTVNMR